MTKGHLQDIRHEVNLKVDPFGSNVAASQAYKTMERLTTATYMVTNLVPECEPMRNRIRDILNTLLEDTLRLRRGFNSLGSDTLKEIVARVRLTMSMLDALYTSGLISKMNLRVLKSAFSTFVESLISMSEAASADGIELTTDYFQIGTTESDVNTNTPTYKPARKLQSNRYSATTQGSTQVQNNSSKLVNSAKVRANNIIEFITKRGSASAGELATVITGCSSKTLQRDLNNLLKRNILKKEGSKRWTRYLMA
jgi:hypothetical protein